MTQRDELLALADEIEACDYLITPGRENMKLMVHALRLSARQYGHTWTSLGGANAGCCEDCCCSIPVNHCVKCGDCDYGENDDAKTVRADCAERRSWDVDPLALSQERNDG